MSRADRIVLPPTHARDAETFRSWYIRYQNAVISTRQGRRQVALATVKAPLRAAREALRAVRTHGPDAASSSGIAGPRQFTRLWWMNLRSRFTPLNFYRFGAYRDETWDNAPLYVQGSEAGIAYRVAARYIDEPAFRTLASKRRFEAWCRTEGMPTASIVASYAGGTLADAVDPDAPLPPQDLFIKWATRYGGDDTMRADWTGERYRCSDDVERTPAELHATLLERSTQGALIVQRLIRNHEAIRRFGRALSTVRVMTARDGSKPPEVLLAVMRMGTGANTADNYAQGGIASNVDLATGIIGESVRLNANEIQETLVTHPDTGASIPGFAIPDWPAVLDLAIRAHDRVGMLPCIGWDVAVTDQGPVLLEGNWNPCVKLAQIPTGCPLLATPFSSVFVRALGDLVSRMSDEELVALANSHPERALND